MAALPRRQLFHCGFIGDTAAGGGDLVLLQPQLVSGFPSELQVAQLVTGGWGRASAVVVGDPPCLFSWGVNSEKPVKGAEQGSGYVREAATDVMFAAMGWEHLLMVRQDGSVRQRGWAGSPVSSPHAPTSTKKADTTLSPSEPVIKIRARGEVTHDISIPNEVVVAVAAGEVHSMALTVSGQVFVWGSNASGQAGTGSKSQHCEVQRVHVSSSMQQISGVPLLSRVTQVACGARHCAAVTREGIVLCWGWALHGQCGLGSMAESVLVATPVTALFGQRATQVAAGLGHTVCCMSDGSAYSWGWGCDGQLGSGRQQASLQPQLLEAPQLERLDIVMVSCGARHTALLTKCGKVFTCGHAAFGQLGLGDTQQRLTPTQVLVPGSRVVDAICGWWHTLFLSIMSPADLTTDLRPALQASSNSKLSKVDPKIELESSFIMLSAAEPVPTPLCEAL